MTRRRDDALRRRLQAAPLPGAAEAERRAWELARAAAPPVRMRSPRARRLRAAAALTVAGTAGALAATPPGEAIGDWFKRTVERAPVTRTVEVAETLPAPGRVLARDGSGIAVVGRDGERTRLGDYDGAAWSPRGSSSSPGAAARCQRWSPTAICVGAYAPPLRSKATPAGRPTATGSPT